MTISYNLYSAGVFIGFLLCFGSLFFFIVNYPNKFNCVPPFFHPYFIIIGPDNVFERMLNIFFIVTVLDANNIARHKFICYNGFVFNLEFRIVLVNIYSFKIIWSTGIQPISYYPVVKLIIIKAPKSAICPDYVFIVRALNIAFWFGVSS